MEKNVFTAMSRAWRKKRTERMLSHLPYEVQKDIGFRLGGPSRQLSHEMQMQKYCCW